MLSIVFYLRGIAKQANQEVKTKYQVQVDF